MCYTVVAQLQCNCTPCCLNLIGQYRNCYNNFYRIFGLKRFWSDFIFGRYYKATFNTVSKCGVHVATPFWVGLSIHTVRYQVTYAHSQLEQAETRQLHWSCNYNTSLSAYF